MRWELRAFKLEGVLGSVITELGIKIDGESLDSCLKNGLISKFGNQVREMEFSSLHSR